MIACSVTNANASAFANNSGFAEPINSNAFATSVADFLVFVATSITFPLNSSKVSPVAPVIADNEAGAYDTWLQKHKLDLSTEDGKDCVCSYVKDYTEIGKVQEIAKIKYNEEDDEVYADET